jgi:hypothetical protein
MTEFLLRFQASDFSNTVFDMPNLSAVRGASLAYLYAPKLVSRELDRILGDKATPIYTGASQGAWTLDCDSRTAIAARDAVRLALRRDDFATGPHGDATGPHSHLSYSVALVEGSGVRELRIAEALNDLERLQGAGFPLPPFSAGVASFDRDGDRTRPADIGGRTSAARAAREKFGRGQRQQFYEDYGGIVPEFAFTDDFSSMVNDPPALTSESPGSKTAIFYADGNRLGSARDAALEVGLGALKDFSLELKTLQNHLLADIVKWLNAGAKAHGTRFLTKDQRLRFETLMWGGDEVLFVMPSWLALEFAARFFEWTAKWKVNGNPVTFAAGLVIANHKTPIRQTKELAKALAERGKGSGEAALQAEIFESLSIPGTDEIAAYRAKLYPPLASIGETELDQALVISPAVLAMFAGIFKKLKDDGGLPRSQLYSVLRAALKEDSPNAGTGEMDPARMVFEKWKQRAGADASVTWDALQILGKGRPPLASLASLAMFWDYADPFRTADEAKHG